MTGQNRDSGGTRTGAAAIGQIVSRARHDLELLIGRRIESVSGVRRHEDGWTVCFEAVEVDRIPDSTSVLGTYEAVVDTDGSLLEYDRTRRYFRNQSSDTEAW